MKRIVICFDGTWNKPADEALPADGPVETNVCRFYESIKDKAADGTKQVKWYDEGVGTKWYDRFIGGSIGAGLELNIVQVTSISLSNTRLATKSTSSGSAAARTRRAA
jgi:uncharacterized protein (DUF2235 family)